MKIFKLVLSVVLVLVSASSMAAWEDTYLSSTKEQYVFESNAGYQYSVKMQEDAGNLVSICSISFDGGHSSFSFIVTKQAEALIDIFYFKNGGNNKYKTLCSSYKDYHKFTAAELGSLKNNQLEAKNDLLVKKIESLALSKELSNLVTLGLTYDIESMQYVEGQAVGKEITVSNAQKNYAYMCAYQSSNMAHAMAVIFYPNTSNTLVMMGTQDGDLQHYLGSCVAFPFDGSVTGRDLYNILHGKSK